MQPKDYLPFLYQRMGDAVTKAWATRAAGAVAWGLGHAVVGHNGRVLVNMIGPEGGQALVERTLEAIDELFPKQPK